MRTPAIGRLAPRRRTGWLWAVLAAASVANALRLRGRAKALRLASVADGPDGDQSLEGSTDPDYLVITAPGVRLNQGVQRAASLHARHHHLEVADLVPQDLESEQALDLVRMVDPATYASDPLATGRGPLQATFVHRSLLERSGITEVGEVEQARYLSLIAELKKFAPAATDLVIVPGLGGAGEDLSQRRACLSSVYAKAAPVVAGLPAVHGALLGVGALVAPGWAAVALASCCAQPYLVFGGTRMCPADLTVWSALTRPLRMTWRSARTWAGRRTPTAPPSPSGPTDDQLATEYGALLADGIDRFFEPRRDTCPLCLGTSLSVRVRVPDLLQFKPGEFELDQCAECAHIFQNPRLSLEGLDFYYRDFYDGMGAEQVEAVFSSDDTSYRGRVDLVAAHARPRRWLDVGAGHGHFCLVASTVLPDTRFEGLDLSDSVVEAQRYGWIDEAHVGQLPELAGGLAGAYDVVSMHHYLEHTRDPAEELRAAGAALQPGGHLLIEVPDPECAYGKLLGWLWGPWFQPQHQHFLSTRNLTALLGDAGFTVVAEERGRAHQPVDLTFALFLLANRIAGPPPKPWLAPPPRRARVRRGVCFSALAPWVVPAVLADRTLAPIVRGGARWSNAYRMLAQKH
jgi:SAM-dependent methyltransferase